MKRAPVIIAAFEDARLDEIPLPESVDVFIGPR